MPTYAAQTNVDSSRSRAEIEHTLTRYGADQFMYGWMKDEALIGFRMHGRMIQFRLKMPRRDAPEFALTPSRRYARSERDQAAAYEQAVRQRWRALALVIKAKLEAVESQITTFEDEFLSATMLPDGSTVGEWAQPQIADAYETGRMPDSLPGLGAASRTTKALPSR
jgi:hypothetical protein